MDKNIENNELTALQDALAMLGIVIRDEDTTDPLIMRKILNEINVDLDMLNDQDSKSISLVKRLMTEKIPLYPLKEKILIGIRQNPPLFHTLIEASHTHGNDHTMRKLNAEQMMQLQYAIYFTVILHVFTQLMVNDKKLEKIIVYSFLKEKNSVYHGSFLYDFLCELIQTNGNLFYALKYISINPAMFESIVCREYSSVPNEEELKKFIEDNHLWGIYGAMIKKRINLMRKKEKNYNPLCANILEALIREKNNVNRALFNTKDENKRIVNNVKAGLSLILYLEKYKNDFSSYELKQSYFMFDEECQSNFSKNHSGFWHDLYHYKNEDNYIKTTNIISKEWVNLYEAWNMAFVLRCFKEQSHLILPKLFIPNTLCGSKEHYLAARITSLWLTARFDNAMRVNKIKTEYAVSNNDHFLELFGKNNLLYATSELFKVDIDIDKLYQERIQEIPSLLNYWRAIKMMR